MIRAMSLSPFPLHDRAAHAQIAAVGVLACTVAFMPAAGAPGEWPLQDTLKSSIAVIGTLLATLFFLWKCRSTPHDDQLALRWHSVLWLPLALALYALVSMAWSDAYLAGAEAVRWATVALLWWLGLQAFNRRTVPTLLWGLHLGLVVASLWAMSQFWGGWSPFAQAESPASTFANRNFFAEYAVCALPYSVLLWSQSTTTRRRVALSLSTACVLVAILMTGTRSALLALTFVTLACIALLWRYPSLAYRHWPLRQKIVSLAAMVCCVLVLGAVPGAGTKLGSGMDTSSALQRSFARATSVGQAALDAQAAPANTVALRMEIWKASLRMVQDHPWSGVGAGNWEVTIPLYQAPMTLADTDYFAHNEALQWLAEYGLPVAGLVLACGLALMIQAAPRLWRDTMASETATGWVAWTSLMALLVVSLFGFPMHLAGCTVLAGLGMALVTLGADPSLAQARAPAPKPPYFALTIWTWALALATVVACAGAVQAVRAERSLIRAIHTTNALLHAQQSGRAADPGALDRALHDAWAGIAIAPHYTKLIALVANNLAQWGDFQNATALWEVVTQARPHYALIWTEMALAYSRKGEPDSALHALDQLDRLTPRQAPTSTLRAIVLTKAGRLTEAAAVVEQQLNTGHWDPALLETGYVLGLNRRDWALSIRCLQLRLAHEPNSAAETYLRMGKIYADPAVGDLQKARSAFGKGFLASAAPERAGYLAQVPMAYKRGLLAVSTSP